MNNIYAIVLDNVNLLEKSFNEDREWKQYGNRLFEKAESLYGKIGTTLNTLFDISNMIARVEMFIKKESNVVITDNSGVVVLNDNNGQIVNNNGTIQLTYELVKETIKEIKSKLNKDHISEIDKNDALEMVDEIEEKVNKKKGMSVIKAALSGLKDFLISAGAALTVEYIKYKMAGIL